MFLRIGAGGVRGRSEEMGFKVIFVFGIHARNSGSASLS